MAPATQFTAEPAATILSVGTGTITGGVSLSTMVKVIVENAPKTTPELDGVPSVMVIVLLADIVVLSVKTSVKLANGSVALKLSTAGLLAGLEVGV